MRSAHVLVGVEDIDVAGPCFVRLAGYGSNEWRVLDERVDRKPLAWLEVQPDVDREPRVVLEPVVCCRHLSEAYVSLLGLPAAADTRLTGVLRFALLAVAVLLVAAGCGSSQKTYTAAATRTCLSKDGATIDGSLDFVASTAIGGAFIAHMPGQPSGDGNWATIAFGSGNADAIQLQLAYERFAFPNVKQNISDVLKRYNNAVTLWHTHPTSDDLALVADCLK